MRLIGAWDGDFERAYALFQRFEVNENGFENPAAGMGRDEFAAYLQSLKDMADGVGLEPGWVAASKFILVNDEGDYVGIVNLRHELTEALRAGAGHIGYGIAPEYRGRGYATEGLRLVLIEARERFGIREAYLSVNKDNPASLAVQRHLGARIDHEDDDHYYTRIDTTAVA